MGRVSAALEKPFLPWQQYVTDVALEVDENGEQAYDVVIILAQRRSGKTVLITPVTAHRCGQAESRSVWLTAQKRDNARKRWLDATDVLMRSSLASKLHRKVSHSFEELTWTGSGSKFVPFAPDEDSMHGEDPDDVWVDELWAHDLEAKRKIQQGYMPTWSVKPGREWLMSAAGTARSGWMKHERVRGRAAVEAGRPTRIAFFEWCVPAEVGGVPVRDLDDELLIQVVLDNHPRRDHGLRADYLRNQLNPEDGEPAMSRSGFLRAYGGLDEDLESEDTVIPQLAFLRAQRPDIRIPVDARVGFGVAVDPDSREVSVSAAWRSPSGQAVTELIALAPGTRWATDRVEPMSIFGLLERNVVGATAVNNVGPARDLADTLELGGVDLLRVSSTDYPAACRRVYDGITEVPAGGEPAVVHDGDDQLSAALHAAGQRKLPSGKVWTSATGAPITVLESHTLAVWAADHMPELSKPLPRFRIY